MFELRSEATVVSFRYESALRKHLKLTPSRWFPPKMVQGQNISKTNPGKPNESLQEEETAPTLSVSTLMHHMSSGKFNQASLHVHVQA